MYYFFLRDGPGCGELEMLLSLGKNVKGTVCRAGSLCSGSSDNRTVLGLPFLIVLVVEQQLLSGINLPLGKDTDSVLSIHHNNLNIPSFLNQNSLFSLGNSSWGLCPND